MHEGLKSTLLVLQNRLDGNDTQRAIRVVEAYGTLSNISCFPAQLNQAFFHVLNNAIDAVEGLNARQPQIVITTDQVGESYRIRIADNGMGMAEPVRTSMFDPFFTTKEIGKGTGLSLAISHQIVVEAHKGELYCDSTEGEGTTVTIVLPGNSTSSL